MSYWLTKSLQLVCDMLAEPEASKTRQASEMLAKSLQEAFLLKFKL